ncbi:hypothetical protein TNCV_3664791 [Trichonephila clavipes]|nr:hypothetical protein TNCV_3664791 [Trichonephila clavipes]
MSIQRDKPSNFDEKTEDMPTQRDKPSHLGVKTTIALDDNEASVSLGQLTKLAPDAEIQVFERYRSRQVAFQADQFVSVTISPSVFVCREEVGVIHRDTNHLGLCAILRYAGNGQFNRNRLTTMVKHVGMGEKR